MSAVSAVIWDLGNVIVRWDRTLLYRKLFSVSVAGEAAMQRFLTEVLPLSSFNERIDLGEDQHALCEEFVGKHPDVDPSLIRAYAERWQEMVGGYIDGSVQLLKHLQLTKVPCFALSNWGTTFRQAEQLYPVFATFDGRVISSEVGLVKPNPAIFQLLLDRFNLSAQNCLFIDDNAANIATAATMGFVVHQFVDPAPLSAQLRELGLL
jgi:2-haloacid dehalogenase